MKTIIYATDFSDNALKAFFFAEDIAARSGAELVMTHVFHLPLAGDNLDFVRYEDFRKELERTTMDQLEEVYKVNRKLDGVLNVRFVAKENYSVTEALQSLIEELNADLVIVGTKGESRLSEILLGSTTKELTETACCPVLAIPPQAESTDIKKIVYSSDFEEKDIAALKKLEEISNLYQSEVTLMHISNEMEEMVHEKQAWFRELLIERNGSDELEYDIIYTNNIADGIRTAVKVKEADMLVMLERKGIAEPRWLHRDVVKKLENSIVIPLLVYNRLCLNKLT